MVLVDSSVWIDYFNGVASPETDTLDALLGQDLVLIGDLILTVGAWPAGYFLGIYRRAFQGPVTSPLVAGAADLLPRELAVAAATCLLVLALGLYPQGVLDLTRSAAELWVARLPSAAAPGRPRKEVTDDDQLDLPL